MDGFWLKSDLFQVEPGEDEEINPRMYGRQLAAWLKSRLEEAGYDIEPVIAEDWGRCLMCSRKPFRLWIGCGNMMDEAEFFEGAPPPPAETILWHCFVVAEVPLLKMLFRRPDTAPAVSKLESDLGRILASEPRIQLLDPPSWYSVT
jgi:hypothetical protein